MRGVLSRVLTTTERERIRREVLGLIAWQRTLRRWPTVPNLPDAMPFVSIYADGLLRGCFGSLEGTPGERVARAFLRALEDSRFGFVRAEERHRLSVVVSYIRSTRPVDPARVVDEVEPGTDGLGVIPPARAAVVLLPHVALETRGGPRELLARLFHKAKLTSWEGCALFALRTENVVIRSGKRRGSSPILEARAAAADWLARLVSPDGRVTFAIDPRRRQCSSTGRMHHGRAAVVLRALGQIRARRRVAERVHDWLSTEIARGLRGERVDGWPSEPAMVAGTLALAQMGGVDVRAPLSEAARNEALLASPWHAAQVVAALGPDAPDGLWRVCVEDLAVRPWAPWTLLAARARNDHALAHNASRALCESIRAAGPHAGGCGKTQVPETALTALVVEALSGLDDPDARSAVERAQGFLATSQLLGESIPAPLDMALAHGAFPASPVVVDHLRCDVVAHALLALQAKPTNPG